MSYQALLFYRDEKTARVLMQVLDELDFSVSPESEPFAAVKTLLAQRFDLLLVDCEDDQNAALLFKSARNSDFNHNAVAVAVTTGQAGIAHAFRAGAGLVLTKPISVEQAKSTLRLARGALRKAEAQKPAELQKPSAPLSLPVALAQAAHAGTDFETAPSPAAPPVFKSVVVPVPIGIEEDEAPPEAEASAAAIAPAADTESPVAIHAVVADEAALEPPEEHLARSGADLSSLQGRPWSPVAEPSPLHLSPKPSSAIVPVPASAPNSKSEEAEKTNSEAAEPAPARSAKEPAAKTQAAKSALTADATMRFASLGIKEEEEDLDPAKSRKNFIIAAILVLALGGGGYYAWMRLHPAISLPFLNNSGTPTVTHPAASAPAPPAQPAVQPAGDASAASSIETGSAAAPGSPLANLAASAPTATGAPGDASKAAAPQAAPSAQPAGPTVLSEEVSQALLTSKVQPIYPEAAKRAHVEGSVRLEVKVSPSGEVAGVKLLEGSPALAGAAIAAVRQWKYQAYYVNGQPVAIETQATLDFKLP